MKKDIEWLKERVLSKKKSAELNVMAHKEGLSEDFESRVIAYESVLKDINQFDKPEVLSQEWIDKYAQGDYGAWVYTKDLQSLIVPKQEVTKVPQEWLDVIKRNKDMTLETILRIANPKREEEERFVKAWLAYPDIEVEEEQ